MTSPPDFRQNELERAFVLNDEFEASLGGEKTVDDDVAQVMVAYVRQHGPLTLKHAVFLAARIRRIVSEAP